MDSRARCIAMRVSFVGEGSDFVTNVSNERRHRPPRPNYPHKLTKAAEPWLGGGAALGRLRTARGRHVGCSSLPPLHVSRGSRRAARGGRQGGRLLQLRVSTLARPHENGPKRGRIIRNLREQVKRRTIAQITPSLSCLAAVRQEMHERHWPSSVCVRQICKQVNSCTHKR